MIPSKKNLQSSFRGLSAANADALRLLMGAAKSGVPRTVDAALEGANMILEGHGVEALRNRGDESWRGYFGDSKFLYVNMGDQYNATIAYNVATGSFLLTDLDTLMQRIERRRPNGRRKSR